MPDITASEQALVVLHTSKPHLNRCRVKLARLALQIHTAQSGKLGLSFRLIATDVVIGAAFALSSTIPSDENCLLPLISTLCSIRGLFKRRLWWSTFHLQWVCKLDAERIILHWEIFRQQLVVFGFQPEWSSEENFSQLSKKHTVTVVDDVCSGYPKTISTEETSPGPDPPAPDTSEGPNNSSPTSPPTTSIDASPSVPIAPTPHVPVVMILMDLSVNITNHHSMNTSTTSTAHSHNNSSRLSALNSSSLS